MISRGIILDSGNKFEIVKTDIFYNFVSNKYVDGDSTEPLWFYNGTKYGRSFTDLNTSSTSNPEPKLVQKLNKKYRSIGKKHKRKKHIKHKIKRFLYKLFKGKRKKFFKSKKFITSIFMGLLLVKIIFIPLVLKTLALIVVKGLIMVFFSTVMASVISLKLMFGTYGLRTRKDEGRTRVEIIHLTDTHDYIYYERPFRRNLVIFPFN